MKVLILALGFLLASPVQSAPTEPATTVRQRRSAPDSIRVWVNLPTKVYHCPGTRWYGKTKRGEYMTQGQAKERGHRPARNRRCV